MVMTFSQYASPSACGTGQLFTHHLLLISQTRRTARRFQTR
jgi:hypothetical protein